MFGVTALFGTHDCVYICHGTALKFIHSFFHEYLMWLRYCARHWKKESEYNIIASSLI